MSIISRVVAFGGALLNLLVALFYLGFAALNSVLYLVQNARALLFFAFLAVVGFLLATYSAQIVENVEYGMRCNVYPAYEMYVVPITHGIIQTWYDPLVCWWDGVMWFPYGIVREVLFPTFRDCGFFELVQALGALLRTIFLDFLVGYLSTGNFLSQELDFTRICAAWQSAWIVWQDLLCCGCAGWCPLLVDLPMVPSFFSSTQWRDAQLWCFVSNTFNGAMVFLQQFFALAREIVYPTGSGLERPTFRRAFDLWCAASACFWRSWENAFQRLWNTFVPYEFVWSDVFCVFDTLTCIVLRWLNLLINVLTHGDLVLQHFTSTVPGGQPDYWVAFVKEDYAEILNLIAHPSDFTPVSVALPGGQPPMEVSSYARGGPRTLSECMCLALNRFFCDPENTGVPCSARYAGTVLATFDFCCHEPLFRWISDLMAWLFEFSLHVNSTDNFIVFLDQQPFSATLKEDYVAFVECMTRIFLVVDEYGACIAVVINELARYWSCMANLIFRVALTSVLLPYYAINLPGVDNFLSNDAALNEALAFLDRLTTTDPNGLLNCLCFLLNMGFAVPYAGCTSVPCVPTGFVNPNMPGARALGPREIYHLGFYNATMALQGKRGLYAHALNPIFTYHPEQKSMDGAALYQTLDRARFQHVLNRTRIGERLDVQLEEFGAAQPSCHSFAQQKNARVVASNITETFSINCTDPMNPPPCFNLCCFARSLILLSAQTTAFAARALQAAYDTRTGMGSAYFDGTACEMGEPCLASDLTQFFVNAVQPLTCLCEFINLVVPPTQGFPNPCCFFTYAGELLSCAAQIIINIGNSVAGDPTFAYIKDPTGLEQDVGVVLDIVVNMTDCGCSFLRIIFNVILTESDLIKNFDPCCILLKLVRVATELLRWLLQISIAFGTVETERGECYFYIQTPDRPNCVPTVEQLPIVVQFDYILDIIVTRESQIPMGCDAQNTEFINPDTEGLPTCICKFFNALLAAVYTNPDPMEPNVCPIDICCPIYRLGIVLDELARLAIRLGATLWQNWEPKTVNTGAGPLTANIPVEFVDAFFCDEYGDFPGPQGNMMGTNDSDVSKCLKFEPALMAIENLLGSCICGETAGFGNVIDSVLAWFLPFVSQAQMFTGLFHVYEWPNCMCQGGPDQTGIFRPYAAFQVTFLRQIVILLRNLANPNYWAPEIGSSILNNAYTSTLVDNFADVQRSWIYRTLAPLIDAVCRMITNAACLLAMVLGNTCEDARYDMVSSAVRYYLEAIVRVVMLFEALIKLFVMEPPGQCVGSPNPGTSIQSYGNASETVSTCSQEYDNTAYGGSTISMSGASPGLSGSNLGGIFVALSTFLVDALAGIPQLGCTTVCPGIYYSDIFENFNPAVQPYVGTAITCECWNTSPYKALAFEYGNLCNATICATQICRECNGTATCTPDEWIENFDCGYFVPDNIAFYACSRGCTDDPLAPDGIAYLPPTAVPWGQYSVTEDYPWTYEAILVGPGTYAPVCTIPATAPAEVISIAVNNLGATMPDYTMDYYVLPVCLRQTCVNNGLCKNDQMVSCTPGGRILDGVIRKLLLLVRCMLRDTNLFGYADQFVQFAIDALLWALSFAWQFSGGIIRYLAAVVVMLLNFLTRLPIVNFFLAIPDILNVFGAFFSMFTQPVIFSSFARDAAPRTFQMDPSDAFDRYASMLYELDTSACVDEPAQCFCRLFTTLSEDDACDVPTNITSTELMEMVTQHFGNTTETPCASLIQHCASPPMEWSTIPYGERVTYVDCVIQHVKGERARDYVSGFIPVDFFYSQDGFLRAYRTIRHFFAHQVNVISRQQAEYQEQQTRHFERAFGENRERYFQRLISRRNYMRARLRSDFGYYDEHPGLEFVVSMDTIWAKYQSGYYGFLGKRAARNIADGYLPLGTLSDNLREIRASFSEMSMAFNQLHLTQMSDLVTRGTGMARSLFGMTSERLVHVDAQTPEERQQASEERVRRMRVRTEEAELPPVLARLRPLSELFAWWTRWRRAPAETTAYFYEPDMRAHLRDTWQSFKPVEWWWRAARWTPAKLEAYEALQSMAWRAYYLIWPHHVTRENYERFVLQSNCRLLDDSVTLASEVIDYCLNEYTVNFPNGSARAYVEQTSHHRARGFHTRFAGRLEVEERADGHWKRFRVQSAPKQSKRVNVHRDVYRRAQHVRQETSSPYDGFFLYDWMLDLFGRIFDIDANQDVNNWFDELRAWFLNTSTEPADWPDVGFLYWVSFPVRCEWPESLNCSIRIYPTFEEALWRVTLIYIIALAVLALAFPGLISVFGFVFNIIVWAFVVMAVAWHYSPACLVMWPSFLTSSQLSLPFLPVPMGAFAIPMCGASDANAFLDKYITNDYSFLLNASMVNGDTAPPCPELIDFVDCKTEVGMGDGLSNLLYAGYRLFGSGWCEFWIGIFQSGAGRLFPGVADYMATLLSRFKNASQREQEQLEICFKWTLPSIGAVLLFTIPLTGVVIFLGPALFGVWQAFLLMLYTLPIYDFVTEQGDPVGYSDIPGDDASVPVEEDEEEEQEEDTGLTPAGARVDERRVGTLPLLIRDAYNALFVRHRKEKNE